MRSMELSELSKTATKQPGGRNSFHRRAVARDLLLWLTAVIGLICTSRTDTGVVAISTAFSERINHDMAMTGWADMLDFCITFRACVISAVNYVA
jgi:tRNA U38,U39,U40 pseudouridine synthase TruA